MGKAKFKAIYVCQNCGKESPKWQGRCPACQEWNCMVETMVTTTKNIDVSRLDTSNVPQELLKVQKDSYTRTAFPIEELNRVLGGGLVAGSVVLISGDPGIGKSTLLLQISDAITRNKNGQVMYVSGEESAQQLKMRAERLGVNGGGLYIYAETNMENVMSRLESMEPDLVVVDSVQTVYLEDMNGAPGSIGQIRECTLRLLRWAKKSSVPVFISGHVTKDGAIAGPKALEHIVDVVLYLEGESFNSYRILRSAKNRFGSTNEVGVFEMCGSGLAEVANPSQFFMESFVNGAIGAAVVPTLEGSRPLLVEIQALTSIAAYGPPRRISNGVDFNRLLLITAVLTRRAGVGLYNQDVIVNVTGGIKISEPAADLAIAMAIASSFRDAHAIPGTVCIGEIGLSGELRSVPQLDRRISEAARLGFTRCIVPASTKKSLAGLNGIEIIKAGNIADALRVGLAKVARRKETEAEQDV
ncbi:MAG: DNA repair protein RadA [Dehalococcoidia bacterium]|nr:DNA repair protein RadA [Dehalococcoidia bacterium]